MQEIYCKVNETPPKPFDCGCGGKIKVIDESNVLHACKHKYSPATSYYDGIDRFIPYKRYRTNWFVDWQTS